MRKHDVRLATLVALSTYTYPISLDRLAGDLQIQAAGVSREEIIEELPGLIDHDFVLDAMRTEAPNNALRITANGRDQVTRDAPLDRYVYGAMAL